LLRVCLSVGACVCVRVSGCQAGWFGAGFCQGTSKRQHVHSDRGCKRYQCAPHATCSYTTIISRGLSSIISRLRSLRLHRHAITGWSRLPCGDVSESEHPHALQVIQV
jgi:hypothetical protein